MSLKDLEKKSMCGVMRMDQVRNEEVQSRTGVTRTLAGRAEQCVEVVWTHGENRGGPVEENGRISCKRCKVERKAKNGMDSVKSVE